MSGIFSEFRRVDPHFEPFVEYLDWKRFPSRENLENVIQTLERKYAGKRFDVIITSDNAALDFVLKYRQQLFKDTPVVFCGVNGYSDVLLGGQGGVTGVTEDLDVAGTIGLIESVLPGTRKILAPIEDTETGQAQRIEMVRAMRERNGRIQIHFLDNPAIEEVIRECGTNSSKDTVLLLSSFGRDRTGRIFPDFGVDLFSAGCDLPIFVMWDFLVGKGALGGSVLSGKLQGREAGKLAIRVLSGERDIPVVRKPPTQTVFDHDQLKRFKVAASSLPDNSLLLNEPLSLVQRYRDFIPWLLGTVVIMAGAIAALSISILARRRVERELDKTKALLAVAVDQSPAGIMVAEAPDVLLTHANPAAVRIMGIQSTPERPASYLREEDIPWTCLRPDGTPYKASELALPRAVLEGAVTDNVEMRILRPDGQERWIMLSASPVRDKQGTIIAGIIVFTDITSRKSMEDMVVQSEKMMSLGGLAAGMAHEINNPLGIIVHSAQNALRRVSPDLPANQKAASEAGTTLEALGTYLEARGITVYMQDIIDAGHRASKIVRSMLNFSRPKASERSPLKVNALLDKALELAQSDYDLKRNYDIKKIRFVKEYDPSGPSGMFVETEIIQVFLNIIKNAAQAMSAKRYGDAQEPTVILRTALEGPDIRVDIMDNGPGMDERTCKRIMEPFFTTKQVGEGTGLGLSVTYFIVTNSYGGTLTVCSEKGRSTAFTIRLPRGRASTDA
ncbi:MAG: ATP-binding protein [Thermodesulfobacteriota bacterium]